MSAVAALPFQTGLDTPFSDWLDVATPAAGAVASVTVAGEWWLRVVAARLSLTTDANAANRLVSLDFVNAKGATFVRNGAGVVWTANTTAQTFEWSRNRSFSEWAANTPVFMPVLDQWLPPGFSVQFAVDAIQATDQISGLRLYVEKWQTGGKSGAVATFDPQPPR